MIIERIYYSLTLISVSQLISPDLTSPHPTTSYLTHICVGNLTIIGSDNGLSPGRRQAIIRTNAGILLIGPLGTNFNENLIGIHSFSFKKMHLKMSSGKWRPFCLGLKVLTSLISPHLSSHLTSPDLIYITMPHLTSHLILYNLISLHFFSSHFTSHNLTSYHFNSLHPIPSSPILIMWCIDRLVCPERITLRWYNRYVERTFLCHFAATIMQLSYNISHAICTRWCCHTKQCGLHVFNHIAKCFLTHWDHDTTK